MDYILKQKRYTILFLFGLLFLIGCWDFLLVDQPEYADPNSSFDVPITLTLTPANEGGRGFFGILLPIGWTAEDSISYDGIHSGTFIYSSAYSDSMENYDSAPSGYYWWVCKSDSVDSLLAGTISFTPQITTDSLTGTFFIDYMFTDRFSGNDLIYHIVRSGYYPISIDAPMTVTVTNTNDSGPGSLRQAFSDVSVGGEIFFDLIYPATITLESQIVINMSVSIIGPDSGEVILVPFGFEINKEFNVNIENITITGARILISNSNPVIKNVKINEGMIWLTKANPHIENVKISGIVGEAGILMYESSPILKNVEITNNSGWLAGGLRIEEDSHVNLINCTISGNKSIYNFIGGIHINYESSLNIVNSIIWDNPPYEIGVNHGGAFPDVYITIMNSLIKDGQQGIHHVNGGGTVYWLEGNINEDPMFVDTANGNYRLQTGSPCIDAGIQDTMIIYNNGQDTLIVPPMAYIGSAPDIGAYEFDPTTDIKEKSITPLKYSLKQNYPNPFNPTTTIEFSIPKSEFVTLKIYNLLGQEVATLVSEKLSPGNYTYTWDATRFASGIYYYKIVAGSFMRTCKMILLR